MGGCWWLVPVQGTGGGLSHLLFGCGGGDSRRVRRRHDGRRRKSHHLLREERQRPPLFSPRHTHTRCTAPSSTTDRRLLARRAAPCRRVVLHTPRREQEESVDDVGDGDRLGRLGRRLRPGMRGEREALRGRVPSVRRGDGHGARERSQPPPQSTTADNVRNVKNSKLAVGLAVTVCSVEDHR